MVILTLCNTIIKQQRHEGCRHEISIKAFNDVVSLNLEVDAGGLLFNIEYIYSIVFNARNDLPYCAVGMRYTRLGDTDPSFMINHDVALEVVDGGSNFSFEGLDDEILNKVYHKGRMLGEYYEEISGDNLWRERYNHGDVLIAPSVNPKMKRIVEKMSSLESVVNEGVEKLMRDFVVSYEYFKSSVDESLKRYYLDQ